MKVALLIPDNRDEFKNYADPQPRFGSAPTALLEGFAQIPECAVHVLCCSHQPLPSPEKLAENIWYHSLVVPKWGWRLGYLGCVWALRRKLRELRPDVVHGQGTERYCALSAVFSGWPNLITVHGNMRAVAKALGAKIFSWHWLTARLECLSLGRTDGVLCLTSYTKAQVKDLAKRTWILPNAVDRAFFGVRRNSDPVPLILCVADPTIYKNQLRLIEALDEIVRSREFRFVLAGKTTPGNAYGVEVLRKCEERSWCTYAGLLEPSALREVLARAHLLVLPSLEDNCPMVILEAMAAGVPVAASAIGGIPDLIEHGVSGLLFDPRETGSIRDAVEALLANSATAERISKVAAERARARFLPEMVARKHLEIYRELLGRE